MGKIKANEIEKHDASQITINSDTHMKAGTTLSVDTIAEKTSGGGINLSNNLGLKSYTTSQINSLSGMTEGDIVYDSTLGSISVYNGTKWAAMSNSTYTVDVDYLIIAGGGAGGGSGTSGNGGGGGAGGYYSSYGSDASGGGDTALDAQSLNVGTNYTVVIGAGAALFTFLLTFFFIAIILILG